MRENQSDVFDLFSEIYTNAAQEEISLQQFLLACREDKSMYASAPERMVAAIGQPNLIDTSKDERLGRIFSNRTVKVYPSFADFYGMEDTIERIAGYFRYASQGLEERKQILYLLGPV
ncbi:MAG: PrkA family serine protein kinase, partial [Mesorhizobium sp.]